VDSGRGFACEASIIAESLIKDTVVAKGATWPASLVGEIGEGAEWTGYACSVGEHQILSVI